jgi:hypothetical protein
METEDWKKSHNKELYNMCTLAVIARVMSWEGQVALM